MKVANVRIRPSARRSRLRTKNDRRRPHNAARNLPSPRRPGWGRRGGRRGEARHCSSAPTCTGSTSRTAPTCLSHSRAPGRAKDQLQPGPVSEGELQSAPTARERRRPDRRRVDVVCIMVSGASCRACVAVSSPSSSPPAPRRRCRRCSPAVAVSVAAAVEPAPIVATFARASTARRRSSGLSKQSAWDSPASAFFSSLSPTCPRPARHARTHRHRCHLRRPRPPPPRPSPPVACHRRAPLASARRRRRMGREWERAHGCCR